MIHKCVVGGCPNRSDTIIHYMLPEDPKRRSLWLKFIEDTKVDEGDATSSCRVCGDHFSEENYFSLDLGYITCRILNVDAVPTVHIVNRLSETQEAEDESIENETCKITISEAISLACVKDEPVEYELTANMPSRLDLNSSLDDDVKHEESEQAVTTRVSRGKGYQVKSKYIECPTCGQRFRRRRTLMKHQRANHANTEAKILTCSTCGEQFNTTALLLKHRNKHHKENPDGKFVCSQCGKGFEHHAFLKAHQKVHEDAESTMPFTCHLCPRRFGYKVALVAHMKHHSSKLTCVCPVCEKSFQFRGSLVQHLKSSHAGDRLLCKTCDRSFLRVNGYVKHMDRHNIMTPFYCDICKIYLSERGYGTHMNTHEPRGGIEPVEEEVDETGESQEGVDGCEGGGDAVRQEVGEVEAEPPAEDERAESSMETSVVQDVEAGKEIPEKEIPEKELPEENHEETEMSEETL